MGHGLRKRISSTVRWIGKQVDDSMYLGITLIMYIFVSNMLGLPFAVVVDGELMVEITNS